MAGKVSRAHICGWCYLQGLTKLNDPPKNAIGSNPSRLLKSKSYNVHSPED